MPGCDDHYRETDRCPDCGETIPVGIPHTMRECAIARERAVQKAQAEGDRLALERRMAAREARQFADDAVRYFSEGGSW